MGNRGDIQQKFFIIPVIASILILGIFGFSGLDQQAHAATVGFQDEYDPSNWTFNANAGDGSWDSTNAPSYISITGDNSGGGAPRTDVTIEICADGDITFDWTYDGERPFLASGPFADPAGFLVNGNPTQLTDNGGEEVQSGTGVVVPVLNGDNFGWYISTIDGLGEPGIFTMIENFSGPDCEPDPKPTQLTMLYESDSVASATIIVTDSLTQGSGTVYTTTPTPVIDNDVFTVDGNPEFGSETVFYVNGVQFDFKHKGDSPEIHTSCSAQLTADGSITASVTEGGITHTLTLVSWVYSGENANCLPEPDPTIGKTLVEDLAKSDIECSTGMPIGALTTTMCTFLLEYTGDSLLIVDTVPAEWEFVSQTGTCDVGPAGKGNPSKSATKIDCGVTDSLSEEFTFQTRQSPGKNNVKFAPTSCDKELKLNESALALDPITMEIIKTSNMIGTPTVDDPNDTDCDQVENDKDQCPFSDPINFGPIDRWGCDTTQTDA